MVVTRFTVVGLVALVAVSVLVPFGGVVAADPSDEERESDDRQNGPLVDTVDSTVGAGENLTESTVGAGENLTEDTASSATNTTDELASDASETPSDSVDAVPTGATETTEGLTGDHDGANASDSEGDTSTGDPIATVERLPWEIDSVTVIAQPDGDDTLRVVVETDDLGENVQPTPSTIDDLAQIIAAAANDPGVVITLVDDDALRSTVQILDGDEGDDVDADVDEGGPTPTETAAGADPDDEDRALAGFAVPDVDGPVEYVAPLAVGTFILLNPLSGLLSSLVAFLAEWAGRLAAVLRYSSRDGSDPLEHETRTEIDEIVTDTPGISLSDLADRIETPLSTVRYHVKVLERERYLASRKYQGHRRLYPMGAATENEELAAAMDNESTATIIESLARQGQATVGDIVDDVGTTYATVSHHLSRLADAGVVQKERDGRCTVSQLDPSARTALHRDLEPAGARPATGASSAD